METSIIEKFFFPLNRRGVINHVLCQYYLVLFAQGCHDSIFYVCLCGRVDEHLGHRAWIFALELYLLVVKVTRRRNESFPVA